MLLSKTLYFDGTSFAVCKKYDLFKQISIFMFCLAVSVSCTGCLQLLEVLESSWMMIMMMIMMMMMMMMIDTPGKFTAFLLCLYNKCEENINKK